MPRAMLVAGLLVVVVFVPPSPRFADYDTAVYGAIAFAVSHGAMLYRDAWEFKNPLAFYLATATQILFPGSIVALNALTLLGVALIVGLLYALLARAHSRLAGGLAALLFACGMTTLRPHFYSADLYVSLLALAGFCCAVAGARSARSRWLLLSGVCCGAGLCFKTSGVLDCTAILCGALYLMRWRGAPWRSVAASGLAWCAGGVLLPAAFAIGFWRAGAWEPFWDGVYAFGRLYVQSHPLTLRLLISLLRDHLGAQLLLATCLTAPGVITGITVWRRAARRDPDEGLAIARAAAIWAVCGAVASLMGRRVGYLQYFWELFVPLAILAGIGLDRLFAGNTVWNGVGAGSSGRAIAALLALSALLTLGAYAHWPLVEWRDMVLGHQRHDVAAEIGARIAANTSPSDRIFVWGVDPGVYYFAQRMPASRFIHIFPLIGDYAGGVRMPDPSISVPQFEAALAASPPAYIVVADKYGFNTPDAPPPDLRRLLADDYLLETRIEAYDLYRWHGKAR